MDYSFNKDIACRYGIDAAVMIHNLYWWIRKNEANGRHYYDGKTWTYNSAKAFSELFAFWSAKQIRRILDKLRDDGVIYICNYNDNKMDRTQWYALSDEVYEIYGDIPKREDCICPNGKMEVPRRANDIDSIYNINNIITDVNTDIKQSTCEKKQKRQMGEEKVIDESGLSETVKSAAKEWLSYKKEQHKFTYSEPGLKAFVKQLEKKVEEYYAPNVINAINGSMANGYKGIVWDTLDKLKKEGRLPNPADEDLNAYYKWLCKKCENLSYDEM